MINAAFIKNYIKKMDKASDEFFELYQLVNDKYWDFGKKPDQQQQAASLLNMLANRGEPDLQVVTAYVAEQVFAVMKKGGAVSGSFTDDKGKEYFFNIYDERQNLDALTKMLMNNVSSQIRLKEEKDETPQGSD